MVEVGMVVLRLATSHDRNSRIAGTFSPPCCLVFVGQDRQSWVPGHLLKIAKRRNGEFQMWKSEMQVEYRFYIY